MVEDAQRLFDQGKVYYEQKKHQDAFTVFSQVVEIQPNNAEFQAWLARILSELGQIDKAISIADKAIAINVRCAAAYWARGIAYHLQKKNAEAMADMTTAIELDSQWASPYNVRGLIYRAQKQYDKSIADCSQAIQLKPGWDAPFFNRGLVYHDLGQYEKAISDYTQAIAIDPEYEMAYANRRNAFNGLGNKEGAFKDQAKLFEWELRPKYQSQESKWQLWLDTIHRHFENTLMPRIKKANEHFVEYWPIRLLWGSGSTYQKSVWEDQAYRYLKGTFGTGYLCLSDLAIYLFVSKDLTNRFPLIDTGLSVSGLIWGTLQRMSGTSEDRNPTNQDFLWRVGYDEIFGIQMTTDEDRSTFLAIRTANENWQVHQFFTDTLIEMEMGIRLGKSGELAAIWKPLVKAQPTTEKRPEASSDVVALLKQLGELKEAGVLSAEEFEQKKKELLSRI